MANELYIDLEDLKAYLRADTDEVDDPILQMCLEGACRSIDDATGKRFFGLADEPSARVYRTHRRVAPVADGQVLLVDDIGSAEGLLVEGFTGSSYSQIAGCELEPDSAIDTGEAATGIFLPRGAFTWYSKVRVTARWGWPEVPAVVKQAALIQASRLFARKDSVSGLMGDANWGMQRIPFIDPDVKRLLRRVSLDGFA